jgi:hypothetical protein
VLTQGDKNGATIIARNWSLFRSEVASAAPRFSVQPSLAAQLGVQQVAKPLLAKLVGQDQDDFDALDLEDYWPRENKIYAPPLSRISLSSGSSIAFTLAQLIVPKFEITGKTCVNQERNKRLIIQAHKLKCVLMEKNSHAIRSL